MNYQIAQNTLNHKPSSSVDVPSDTTENAVQDLLTFAPNSKIDPLTEWARQDWSASGALELFDANVQVVEGLAALNKILIGDLPRTNTGRVSAGTLQKYDHLYEGGWYVPTLDPLDNFSVDSWGTIKPIKPRYQSACGVTKPKKIKYENPPKCPIQPYFLRVTLEVWQRIANRYGLELPAILANATVYGQEFWEWVIANNLPVIIDEGVKKVASLLCTGYVAVGVSGIWNFSRKIEDKESWQCPLNERLAGFFKQFKDPQITIAFDSDSKPKTIKLVKLAATRLSKKLESECNAKCKIASWHTDLGKGIDDVLVKLGVGTVERILDSAVPYKVHNYFDSLKLTYKAQTQSQRYLEIPNAFGIGKKIIAIKSPKNTGKTHQLGKIVEQYLAVGTPVILISHRVQLCSQLSSRLGVEFLNEIRTEEQWQMARLLGFGLCIDSLHPLSKARFDLTDNDNFQDAVVIVDEAEQVFAHLIEGKTVGSNRAEITWQLKELLSRAGKVYLADADLSDLAIDFTREMSGAGVGDVDVLVNDYQFKSEAWNVQFFGGQKPQALLNHAITMLEQGQRVLLHVSGQKAKSKYGSKTIEQLFQTRFPNKKILRIDRQTVGNPDHPAYGIIGNLNESLEGFDIVIASPVIETGVSIERDLFDAVFGISWGLQSVSGFLQAIARYRPNVPRYIWCQNRPTHMMKFGGAKSAKQIKHFIKRNDRLLKTTKLDIANYEAISESEEFINPLLSTYCKLIERFNLGHEAYRDNLIETLRIDGHKVSDEISEVNTNSSDLTEIRDNLYQSEIDATLNSKDVPLTQLKDKTAKTDEETFQERKAEIKEQYGTVTEEIIRADDEGIYGKLQLSFYLKYPDLVGQHDSHKIATNTAHNIYLNHEANKKSLRVQVAAFQRLELAEFLKCDNFTDSHPIMEIIQRLDAGDFTAVFGRKFPTRLGDRLNVILDLVGHKRTMTGWCSRKRVYQIESQLNPKTVDEIFEYWQDKIKSAETRSPNFFLEGVHPPCETAQNKTGPCFEANHTQNDHLLNKTPETYTPQEIDARSPNSLLNIYIDTETEKLINPISDLDDGVAQDSLQKFDCEIETDMWGMVWDALALDDALESFGYVWQAVKAMGMQWAKKVANEIPSAVMEVDPEWALGL